MKTSFVIVIIKQCACGREGCTETFFVNGDNIVRELPKAQHFDTYPECEKMINEMISENNVLPDDVRMKLLFSIEKFYS